jgi:hypothetical protein
MNAIEQLKVIKANKQLLKKQQSALRIQYLVERAKLAEKYAQSLEALIEGQFDDADETIPLVKCVLPVEVFETKEEIPDCVEILTDDEEIVVNIPAEAIEEVVEIIPEPVAEEVSEIIPEPVAEIIPEPVKEKVDLKQELVKFLMNNFVKKEENINNSVAEFYEMFGVECGKNTFTKGLNELGIRHYKSNGVIKYKYNFEDVKRVILPFWTEPENIPEITESQVEEQTTENNLFLMMDSLAEEVELKKSPTLSQKVKAKLDEIV